MTNKDSLEFKEIEYKYKADNIDMSTFEEICNRISKDYTCTKAISKDVFYIRKDEVKNDGPNIVRYRFSDDVARSDDDVKDNFKELTLKKNTGSENCVNRIEINLKLDSSTKLDTVNNFMNILNYDYHYTIIKQFNIYHYDFCELVYYIVYKEFDDIMTENKIFDESYQRTVKEIGRYIEIEAINCKTEKEAIGAINKYENLLTHYLLEKGILLNNRINTSLYELCKPEFT